MLSAFGVHVATLVAGAMAVLAAIAFVTPVPLAVAGAFLLASGAAAFTGRRSLLVPRAARARIEAATPEERGRIEQASGMLVGVLLAFFGAVTLTVGLWITLA